MTLIAMLLSGGVAGLVAMPELLGRDYTYGITATQMYGFTGIAVALLGRNHPVGVVLASLLFGALYQGGAELSFEIPAITRETVVVIQGLVILFSGALANLPRSWFAGLIAVIRRNRLGAVATGEP